VTNVWPVLIDGSAATVFLDFFKDGGGVGKMDVDERLEGLELERFLVLVERRRTC